MARISVLFVDDEEDIRQTFFDRFERQFAITLASNGQEALALLADGTPVSVVVTDIRMPELNGLEMIREAKRLHPDLGFIVVSGHGDAEDVIEAMRLGARNFIRKPYSFSELEEAIVLEARRFQVMREERSRREVERATEQFLVGVERMVFHLPNDPDWVNPVAFRVVRIMEAAGVCEATASGNIALGLIELIMNAIEHGNLGLTGSDKVELMNQGSQAYEAELQRRAQIAPYSDRKVQVVVSIDEDRASIRIEDEGDGFNFQELPDPTNPDNLFLPNGRGVLLARSFIDDVRYQGRGNVVELVHHRHRPA